MSWRPSLRRLPFRVRLTLGFAGTMVVLFGTLALVLHTLFARSLAVGIDRGLSTRAAELANIVDGKRQLPQLAESGGAFAQIIDPRTGRVLDATPGYAVPLLTSTQLPQAMRRSLMVNHRGDARLLAQAVTTRPAAVLVVGSSLAQSNRALTTLDDLLFIGGPLLLLLTCLAGYVLAARALAPVERIRAHAARISGDPKGERLPIPEAHDELQRLGETLNAMLSRLEDALKRERVFVADAGHELMTPLSILKLELELAAAPDSSVEELQARLRSAAEEVERLAKLARELLIIARAEQGRLSIDKQHLAVAQVLGGVVDRFAVAAREHGRVVTLDPVAEGLVVDADRARLEQALTNMVLNALRHGRGDVTVRATQRGPRVELHVLDDGNGFDPEFLPHAFERFSRGDPARSGGGAGLGLAIVRTIAEAHGGGAHAHNLDGGGADVWLSLPRAALGATSSDPLPASGSPPLLVGPREAHR